MKRKTYYTKRCPRCGTKNNYTNSKCTQCGLIFSRVENGSNKLAKGLILSGQKNLTLKAPGFPKDVSKKKFLFLCGFLGLFGAHNFYVGRYVKAIYQIIIGIFSVIATVLSGYVGFIGNIMPFMCIFVAVNAFMWMFDFVDGVLNKYRIPVAVDFTNGKLSENNEKKTKKENTENLENEKKEEINSETVEELNAEKTHDKSE